MMPASLLPSHHPVVRTIQRNPLRSIIRLESQKVLREQDFLLLLDLFYNHVLP